MTTGEQVRKLWAGGKLQAALATSPEKTEWLSTTQASLIPGVPNLYVLGGAGVLLLLLLGGRRQ